MAPLVKNPPAKQEMEVRLLGWKDLLKKEMATHSSIFVWEIPWAEGAWQAIAQGVTKVSDMTYQRSNDNMWDTSTPMADSCQCTAKTTTIL